MSIYEGLAANRVRQDAEPTYVHNVCRQVLRECPGRPDTDDAVWLLKCDACNKVIGEWLTKDEMNMELRAWWQIMDNKDYSMKQLPKRRFSVGRRVLVGIGMRVGTVRSVDDAPSVLGEFAHEVLVDGEKQPLRVLGCDLQPVPDLDEDLRGTNRPTIHIQNSNVANLNIGSQVGTINAASESISGSGDAQEFARALKELTEAVVSCQSTLHDTEKQEFVQVLSTIAEQAARKPEERSKGTLKAAVAWIPTAISAASNLASLWDKVGPTIRTYLGV
jgi:hypothetical protein